MDKGIIRSIVRASGVCPGEVVLVHFWGEDDDKQIANDFVCAVAESGASPVLLQQARSINQVLFENAEDSCFDDRYFYMFSNVDAVLDVFAYQPIVLGGKLRQEGLQRYRRYIARLFDCLMKCKRFAQIRIPTTANADESGLAPEDYIRRMTEAYDIDYAQLNSRCNEFVQRLEQLERLTLWTGTDCKLHFCLSGRTWHIDAGDGDWPCGEVYIAPVEDLTSGEVYFDRLYIEDQGVFDKVKIHIESGRALSSDHKDVDLFLKQLPEENSVVCELGFGMNPNVKDLCGYTVLDEKMAGTFHIAIGANTMFGGENKASIHLDLVGTGEIAEIIEICR